MLDNAIVAGRKVHVKKDSHLSFVDFDVTPPLLVVLSPQTGAFLSDSLPAVAATVADDFSGIDSETLELRLDGVDHTEEVTFVENEIAWTPGEPLVDGVHGLEIAVRDRSANETLETVSFTVDTVAPSIAIELPADGDLVTAPTIRVQGTVMSDQTPIGSLTIDRQPAAVDGEAFAGAAALRQGTNTVTVAATDSVGHESSASVTVTLDSQPPDLTLLAPVSGQVTNQPTMVFAGEVYDAVGLVVFQVVQGAGTFSNGTGETVVSSDGEGRAAATLRLDSEEGVGNSVVEARLVDHFATFSASGRAAGDPAQTSIRGIVLDNTDDPVPEATVHVAGTDLSAVTDGEGIFRIPGAPVGSILLEVDGSTTSRPGAWPHLEFPMTTIPGRDNTLGRPIYLLPLDVGRGVVVSETEGGTLTLPELPGFALEIAPGSVTFPDGSQSGEVSVTLVHSDKVPMVPNFGQQPRFVITIQPGGAKFDPPAPMTLPNVDGLAPGEVTELYSFDHDLMSFVSIGPGTVSEDGAVVHSDPGVGVVEAGWHCGGSPSGSGTPHDCPQCKTATGSSCVAGCSPPALDGPGEDPAAFADKACNCSGNARCKFNYRCVNGKCTSDKVKVTAVTGPCLVEVGSPASFTAEGNFPAKARWKARGGEPSNGVGSTFTTTFSSTRRETVSAGCRGDSQSTTVDVVSSCNEIVSELVEPAMAGTVNAWAVFGVTLHGPRRPRYTGCGNAQQWCFRLVQYRIDHTTALANYDFDISGPEDPDVTPESCVDIIVDLTPFSNAEGPPRTKYWSRLITISHEQIHVEEFTQDVALPTFGALQSFVAGSACTACKTELPIARFNRKEIAEFTPLARAWKFEKERRAHSVTNPLYDDLVEEIRERARNAPKAEGWPDECK